MPRLTYPALDSTVYDICQYHCAGFEHVPYRIKGYFNVPEYTKFFNARANKLRTRLALQLAILDDDVIWELYLVAIWRKKPSVISAISVVCRQQLSTQLYAALVNTGNFTLYEFLHEEKLIRHSCPIIYAIPVSLEAVKFFTERGYEVTQDHLHEAIVGGYYSLIYYFVENLGIIPCEMDICAAFKDDNDACIRFLIDYAPKSSSYYKYCLHEINSVIIVYEAGHPVNEEIITMAMESNLTDVIEYFGEMGCRIPNQEAVSPIIDN